jgi:hypothetical protein
MRIGTILQAVRPLRMEISHAHPPARRARFRCHPAVRLRLQPDPDQRRRRERGVVRSAQPVQAPRRPDSQSGADGARLCRARKGSPDPRLRGARECRRDQGHARADQRSGGVRQVPEGHRASSGARWRACWPSPRTIPSSRPTPISATCRPSWKAPRTASPWRATATSRPCRSTTFRCAPSPTT